MKEISILDQFKGFLNTPDIFPKEYQNEIKRFAFPKPEITAALISDLEKLDHPRNSVLGKRMESFFEIAIRHSERYDLINSNLQIIENKTTIGELDFLLFDKFESKTIHVELVYKLYVHDTKFANELDGWIGPNRKDSFSEKIEKLIQKQFPLLYKPETLKYLKELNLNPEEIEQQLCFKAQLFSPAINNLETKTKLNSDCIRGSWYHFDEFLKKDWKKNQFLTPKKKDWSCHPEGNSAWLDYEETIKQIKILFDHEKSPLVWMKTQTSYQSFFIVWW